MLQVGTHLLGDRDGPLGGFEAAPIVQFERAHPRQPLVGHRQVSRRTRGLEDLEGELVLGASRIRALRFPVTASEHEAIAGRLDVFTQAFEGFDATRQVAHSAGRRPISLLVAPDPAQDSGLLERIGDVGQDALENRDCLSKGERGLRLFCAAQADGDGLLEPAGTEKVAGQVDSSRRYGLAHRIGGPRVDGLPPRRHDLRVDRLLGEGVPPAIAARMARVLLEQLLRHRCVDGAMDHWLWLSRDREQRLGIEAAAQDCGGLQDANLVLAEPPHA